MQPINYTYDVQSPFDALAQGYNRGWNQNLGELQLGMAIKQQAQAQKMQADFNALAAKPNKTLDDYASLMTKYPDYSDKLSRPYTLLDANQQKNRVSQLGQVYSALQNGNPNVANSLLDQYAQSYKNKGYTQEAQDALQLKNLVQSNPQMAQTAVGLLLSPMLGSGGAQNYIGLQTAPSQVKEAAANADIKDVQAQYAPETMGLANQNSAEDIVKKQLDRKLSLIDSQIKQTNSETQVGQLQVARDNLQLERDKLDQKTQGDQQTDAMKAQDGLNTVKNSLNTIDKILADPSAQPGKWTGTGSIYGAASAYFAGSDRRDLNNLVETLKSQAFLSALEKLKASSGKGSSGLGTITNVKINKLSNSIATLDPNSKSFIDNVLAIRDDLLDLQNSIIGSGKLPTTNTGPGNAFVMNHPTKGPITEAAINRVLVKNPGYTRQNVIDYLKMTGGQ